MNVASLSLGKSAAVINNSISTRNVPDPVQL